MKIIALSGSLRKDSFNRKLVDALPGLAPAGMEIEKVEIGNLPLYNQDLEGALPAEVQAFKAKIEAADGVIFVTPEFNRSFSGVLKNAIDWGSRPWGKNSWGGKRTITMGVSIGKIGTALAQAHLKDILLYLGMRVFGQPEVYIGPAGEVFDAQGALTSEPTKELLKNALAALAQQ